MKRFCKALFLSLLMLVGIHALADNVTEGNRLYRAKQYEEAMSFFMKLDGNPPTKKVRTEVEFSR